MKKERISPRQLMLLASVAVIASAVRTLPPHAAGAAAEGAWLSPFVLFLAGLPLIGLYGSLQKRFPDLALDGIILRVFGSLAGRLLLTALLLLALFNTAAVTHGFSKSFVTTYYTQSSPMFFTLTALLFVYFAARGRISSLSRMNLVFILVSLLALVPAFALSLGSVKPERLWPVGVPDLPGIAYGAVAGLRYLPFIVFAGFLCSGVTNKERLGRHALVSLGGVCALLILFNAYVVGILGPTLASRMDAPLFIAVKSASAAGVFERLDPLILSVWLFGDLISVTFLTRVSARVLCVLLKREDEVFFVLPVLLVTAALELTAGKYGFIFERGAFEALLLCSLGAGCGIPVVTWLVSWFVKEENKK